MSNSNLGPAAQVSTNLTAQMTAPAVSNLTGTYTFATLPTTGLQPGAQAYTTDVGVQTWTGTAWVAATPSASPVSLATRRATNIANFLSGARIAAPAWVGATAYVVGNCVTIPSGQVLTCIVAGTSAGAAPVFSKSILTGRPIVDNTATWSGCYVLNGVTSDVTAPTSTQYASAAAAGLTEQNLISGTLSPLLTCFGGTLTRNGFQNAAAAFTFASGPAAGSGNATGIATGAGFNAAFVYNSYNYDIEFYITDSVVGLTFVGSTAVLSVEIDGVLMNANAPLGNGTAGQALVFDFNGIVRRRKVCVSCSTPAGSSALRGVALSTVGFIEATDSPNDQMLLLGDSILQTVSANAPNMPILYLGSLLKRYLGLAGVIGAGLGGSGYIAQTVNTYNALNILLNPINQQIFRTYAPNHILIAEGYNDIGASTAAAVAAAALQVWTLARSLFPNAKITVTDGFSQAKGPDTASIQQSAALLAQYNAWGDTNSRFIQTMATAATAWQQGTATATNAIALGNTCNYVGTDNVHPTALGADFLAYRLANAIQTAWNGNY
jgi:lysophospholipase L1-like esterase